ncbi:glycosyltransferase family 2 protein [Chromobacterium amazonense]|uniref:Glycosyltransferase family 2 protein n=1 Tax=Chromobacterium amazonense TaxID=1382803 RepID=A0ABU8UXA3_9NEIS|nr:glycosyltransferase family 2 protein [Chromobacterium amazonense]MDQ4539186.1 glycosyltransferase family 2 protein [Chromobacterium amazonense]
MMNAAFLWHALHGRFAQALSCLPPVSGRKPGDLELWSLYKLGMYQTVSDAPVTHRLGRLGLFAQTVSRAACGQTGAVQASLATWRQQRVIPRLNIAMADTLVPLMPASALKLLACCPKPPAALHIATLLRNEKTAEAQHQLHTIPPSVFQRQPELHLFHTNAFGGAPAEQLQRLNAFLAALKVPSLRLLDPTQPPSVMNVAVAATSKPVCGPLVTVLMTTFRTSSRAVTAIKSVLAQSYQELELIVVDDASDDDTPALVANLARRDTRIRLITLPRNVGTYVAKRIGLEHARGEFVTCHDSDDWMHPERLARQVAPLLADKRLIATTSDWVRIQDDGVFYARPVHPLKRINPASPLFRREKVLWDTGAWDCVRTGADSEFLARLRVVYGPKAIKKIRQPLALGCHRPDSLMTAAGTGYSETGVSPHRLAYWEAWSHWHIATLAEGKMPRISSDIRTATLTRPFPVQSKQYIEADNLEACLLEALK